MEAFVRMVDDEYRKGHFADVWEPRKRQEACLLSPDGSKLVGVTSSAQAAPDVRTIGGLQKALKMLGYRITADGDYGPETRQAVTSFQMHAGIVADGIAGAQTEAELTKEPCI
jgi:peptidoglycan hydrolase-like protein with peptidoglycan-binding domain